MRVLPPQIDAAARASMGPQAGTVAAGKAVDGAGRGSVPANPAEAARQFEEVLVREFVKTMTKDIFSGGLAGEGGAGWVKAQGEAQGDALTDAVTKHLVESGAMGIQDMLLKKWSAQDDGGAAEIGKAFELKGSEPLPLRDMLQFRLNQIGGEGKDGILNFENPNSDRFHAIRRPIVAAEGAPRSGSGSEDSP